MPTNVEEGTIVRCITRLDETCREVRNIARVIGDPGLYQKMEEALTTGNIVFATSLYLLIDAAYLLDFTLFGS